MAIQQANSNQPKPSFNLRKIPAGYLENTSPWRVRCDFCGCDACKDGGTAGDAADAARREGFATVPNKNVLLPSKWACPGCKRAIDNEKKKKV